MQVYLVGGAVRDALLGVAVKERDWVVVGGTREELLRHVSPAFVEDPVRVLRVARFAARFAPLGFQVAPETLELMRAMVDRGEVDALVPERVWQETEKALRESKASEFFRVLRACGSLRPIYPELDALFGVPQPAQWHPEIDTGVHTLMVLDQAALLSPDPQVRFAALVHDLGKGATPRAQWPSHRGHEERSVSLVEAMAERLRLPGDYRDLAIIVARYHGIVHRAFELRPKTILEFMERADAFRRPERFAQALLACEADARGRTGLENRPYPQRAYLQAARDIAAAIKPTPEDIAAHAGPELAKRLHQSRAHAIAELRERSRTG